MVGERRFAYQPALDGVRAVSIAVVLAFHLGAPWMPGGYLGVSVFFTLSGFLITSLLLEERATTGRIAVREFYVRRMRRLLPASLLCLAGIAVLAAVGVVAERESLRGDVLGGLLQVANWRALLADQSYGDLFRAPSPVAHFWSLAIEEQFYWVWPLAMAGLLGWVARRGGGPRRVAVVLTMAFVGFSASALATAAWWSADAAYYASWARFAEILAGAALAAVVARRELPARLAVLAPLCLAVVVALSVVTPAGHGWAYAGGLPLFSLVTVGLIAGLQVDGPVKSVLSQRPVVWVGQVSYGLYLYHWPVFAVLDRQRTGQSGLSLVAVRLGVTLLLTVVSYRLIERPVRTRRVLVRTGSYLGGATTAFATVLALALVVVPTVARTGDSGGAVVIAAVGGPAEAATAPVEPAPAGNQPSTPIPSSASGAIALSGGTGDASAAVAADGTVDTGTAGSAVLAEADDPDARPASPPVTVPAPVTARSAGPVTAAVFGDSVADWLLRQGTVGWDRRDVTLVDAAHEGCDAANRIPAGRDRHGVELVLPDGCEAWPTAYREVVEDQALPVDVAVLVLGQAVTVDRRVGGRWVGPCEDMAWYTDDVAARVAYLRRHVDDVVLVLPAWGGRGATWSLADDHLDRMACIRAELAGLAERLDLPTVDLAEVLCPAGPKGACNDLRHRDGTHVDPEDAPFVLDWLLDRLPSG